MTSEMGDRERRLIKIEGITDQEAEEHLREERRRNSAEIPAEIQEAKMAKWHVLLERTSEILRTEWSTVEVDASSAEEAQALVQQRIDQDGDLLEEKWV